MLHAGTVAVSRDVCGWGTALTNSNGMSQHIYRIKVKEKSQVF